MPQRRSSTAVHSNTASPTAGAPHSFPGPRPDSCTCASASSGSGSPNGGSHGLGLALGNGDVTLIELANGYRALAMAGEWRPWTWHPASAGAAPGRAIGETRRVMSPMASAILLDMLSDPAARIPGFGIETPFDFPFPVAVKTGTSRHFTDNWAVATTRGFTVAVWAGNFSGRPMQGVSGVTGAGPLLHRVVMETAKRRAPGVLTTPANAGAIAVGVCRLSGLRATPDCAQLTERFAPGTAPRAIDDWERGGRVVLPDEYAEWARQESRPAAKHGPLVAVRGARDRATADRFRIMSPRDGDRYAVPAGVASRYATIALRAGGAGAHEVIWTVDDKVFTGNRWSLVSGTHTIRATSARGERAEVQVTVER